MDIFPGSHKLYQKYFPDSYHHDTYCPFWKHNSSWIEENIQHKRVNNLKPGTVLMFQGGFWHRLNYSSKCTETTCRRVTLRYADGSTKWREDRDLGKWPVLQQIGETGVHINKSLPIVYNT
eukprot:UN05164